MHRLLTKLSLAASIAAAALLLSPISAQAQKIYIVDGGRTTLTLSKAALADFTKLGITPTAIAGSQLYNNQIYFPITSGAVNLDNAYGQMLHAGGINLTAGTKQVRLDSFVFSTSGEESVVTALVIVDGKFLGRIPVFDIELPSDLTLPLDPKDGNFFLAGVKWNLDPQAVAALNDAFKTTIFENNLFIGNSLSLVLMPLNADGQ
jgi:hypothetical protein